MYSEGAEASIDDSTLSALISTAFATYHDRPCIGTPVEGTRRWRWSSYAEVWSVAQRYCADLSHCLDTPFVVACFEQSCLELVALDVAVALVGLCSVIVSGQEQTTHTLEALGTANCTVVSGPPAEQRPEAGGDPPRLPAALEGSDDGSALFTLFCTSGSTGVSKLVRRTRAAWLDIARDTAQFGTHLCVTLAFSSLAHSGPRTELWWNLACGGQTALADASIPILDSLEALSPTEVAAPPSVWAEVRRALAAAGVSTPKQLKRHHPGLLRRLHSISTGSARCDPDLFRFLRDTFGNDVAVSDNYGSTEVGAIATDGVVNFNVKAKLLEIPELGIAFPRGEICVKCEDAFEGYFLDGEASRVAMTEDGFFRTGDVGEEVRPGVIRVVDRIAGMVKLASGKFCSLEDADALVRSADPAIEQVCALEFAGALLAVVHAPGLPEPLPWLGVPAVRASERFNPANGMLTPSLKLCRRVVLEKHKELLQDALAHSRGMLEAWLSSRRGGEPGPGLDLSLPLGLLGVTSLQFARLAAELGVPVHAVASAESLHDLHALSRMDSRGVAAARADCERLGREPWDGGAREAVPATAWRKVLVTGATGHIGRQFAEMLERQGFAVVRASRSTGFDVSKPRFGLDAASYQELAASCDAVVHCAALVNWSASYSALRGSNVEGVLHVAHFCRGGSEAGLPREKALLLVGSGADFPESPASLEWLEECCSPYMVSKIAAEALAQRLCPQAVVVRPGLVVWHSETGRHNASDAVSRLARAVAQDRSLWVADEPADDLVDGMNVDAFCEAAIEVFRKGGPAVYNMRGAFEFSRLVDAYGVAVTRVPYAEWYQATARACKEDAAHPLAALLPHIEPELPPFTLASRDTLSQKCRAALGPELAGRLTCVGGYRAFAGALRASRGE